MMATSTHCHKNDMTNKALATVTPVEHMKPQ